MQLNRPSHQNQLTSKSKLSVTYPVTRHASQPITAHFGSLQSNQMAQICDLITQSWSFEIASWISVNESATLKLAYLNH